MDNDYGLFTDVDAEADRVMEKTSKLIESMFRIGYRMAMQDAEAGVSDEDAAWLEVKARVDP